MHKIISIVATNTFGIYLVHVFFLDWCYRLGFFKENYTWCWHVPPALNIPIRSIVIYAVSLFITMAVNRWVREGKNQLLIIIRGRI